MRVRAICISVMVNYFPPIIPPPISSHHHPSSSTPMPLLSQSRECQWILSSVSFLSLKDHDRPNSATFPSKFHLCPHRLLHDRLTHTHTHTLIKSNHFIFTNASVAKKQKINLFPYSLQVFKSRLTSFSCFG